MRITNKVLANGYLTDLNRNLENMKKLQEQMSSGKEIRRPSDDPFKVARTMELMDDISGNERYSKNIDEGLGWLNSVESSMGLMTDALQTIREKTVAGGTDTNSAASRKAISDNIKALKDNLVSLGNTVFDGRYVFGGDKTTEPPFETKDGEVVYNGSENGIIREFAQGVRMDIGVTGNEFLQLFGNQEIPGTGYTIDKSTSISKTGTPDDNGKIYEVTVDGVDNDGTVNKLKLKIGDEEINITADGDIKDKANTSIGKVSGLNSDNANVEINGITLNIGKNLSNKKGDVYSFNSKSTVNVLDKILNNLNNNKSSSEYLGELDSKMDNVMRMRSEEGAKWQRLNDMKKKSDEENFNMTELLSKTSDIDVAKKYMEFKVMESVYVASLESASKILQPSLLDFLR